jgi:S1-C subfamily serine protease
MALFALSNLVDTETLAALLAGGDTFLSRVSLSKLASQRDDAIGRAAQKILNSDSSALRPSVFQVSRADMGRAQATGFLCAQPDLVVTYAIADPKAAVSVIDADGEHLSGKAILVDRRTGLLAIQLDQPLKGAHPLLISDRFNLESEPGTTVSALTWVPGSTFRARTGVLSRTDLRGLTIMGLTSGGDGPLPFNEFRIPVEPGVAGAPILNRSDEVCGVVVAGTQDGSISYSPNPEAIAGFVNHALEMCAPASRRRSHQRTRQ